MKKSLVFMVAILVFLVHLGSAIRVGFEVSSDWDVSVSSIQKSPNFFHVRNKSDSLVLTYTDNSYEHVTEPSKAQLGMSPAPLLPAYNSSAVNLHTQGSDSRDALIRFRLTKAETISSNNNSSIIKSFEKQQELANQIRLKSVIMILHILLSLRLMVRTVRFYTHIIGFRNLFRIEDHLNHDD